MDPTEPRKDLAKDDEHLAPESGDSPERERQAQGDLTFEEREESEAEKDDLGGTGASGRTIAE